LKLATATLKRQAAITILQPAILKLSTATLKLKAENTKHKLGTLILKTEILILKRLNKKIIETKKKRTHNSGLAQLGF
jgi:hypothetical protein